MHYFIIDFLVKIDDVNKTGRIGSTSTSKDYKPNVVKRTITEHYRKNHLQSKIAVVLPNVTEVDFEQYKEASKGFLNLE